MVFRYVTTKYCVLNLTACEIPPTVSDLKTLGEPEKHGSNFGISRLTRLG